MYLIFRALILRLSNKIVYSTTYLVEKLFFHRNFGKECGNSNNYLHIQLKHSKGLAYITLVFLPSKYKTIRRGGRRDILNNFKSYLVQWSVDETPWCGTYLSYMSMKIHIFKNSNKISKIESSIIQLCKIGYQN